MFPGLEVPLSFRITLLCIAIATGFPTTYYGYLIYQGKFGMQQAYCRQDLYTSALSRPMALTNEQTAIDDAQSFKACLSGIDPKMSTIDFMKMERERARR